MSHAARLCRRRALPSAASAVGGGLLGTKPVATLCEAAAPLERRRAAAAARAQRRFSSRRPYVEDPRGKPFAERGFVARDVPRAARYWPPPDTAAAPIPLPGGRKRVSVHAMRRDVDGLLEAQVVVSTRGGHRLFSLNEEELTELEKLAPRLNEYLALWQEKLQHDYEVAQDRRTRGELEQSMKKQFLE
mmetsp:Transcript_33135/g.91563  ORF Transcript_33135/g.91563 Transcript_33135/m.91563 type:complete len:189 (-) Transcript_33135:27-593(-)